MHPLLQLFILMAVSVLLVGCADPDQGSPEDPNPDTGVTTGGTPDRLRIVDENSYEMPPPVIGGEDQQQPDAAKEGSRQVFRTAINVRESVPLQYSAVIETTAPTGGWTMKLERSELVDGVLDAYVVLEKPAMDEIVTTALVTHREEIDTGHQEIASIRVFVKQTERGADNSKSEFVPARTLPLKNG